MGVCVCVKECVFCGHISTCEFVCVPNLCRSQSLWLTQPSTIAAAITSLLYVFILFKKGDYTDKRTHTERSGEETLPVVFLRRAVVKPSCKTNSGEKKQ